MNKKKIIIIISCIALVVCAALVSVYFYNDYQNKLKEQEARELREQYIQEVLQFIDSQSSTFNNSDNIVYKISIYNNLTDYQLAFKNSDFESDEVSTRLNAVLSSMTNTFYDTYITMIGDVAELAATNLLERQQYIFNKLADIDSLYERFNAVEVDVVLFNNDEEDENTYCGRTERVAIFRELSAFRMRFINDTFINNNINNVKSYIEDLESIKTLIETDSVITDPAKLRELNNKIDELIELYKLELLIDDYDNTLLRSDTAIDDKKAWFFSHYNTLIEEISERERENDNDKVTINKQIDDFELLKEILQNEGMLDEDNENALMAIINEFLEDYIEYIERIEEAERRARAAAAADYERRAAAERQRQADEAARGPQRPSGGNLIMICPRCGHAHIGAIYTTCAGGCGARFVP